MHVASIRIGSLLVASFACAVVDEAAGADVCAVVRRLAAEVPSEIVLDFRATTAVTAAGVRWLRFLRATLRPGTRLVVSGLGELEAYSLRRALGHAGIQVAAGAAAPSVTLPS